jgi:MarR-like DNA-binding transcriptional regulator SgrR of sgrS sRNA
MQDELGGVLAGAVETSVQYHIEQPYLDMVTEYTVKQHQANDEVGEFVDQCKKVMQKGLGLRESSEAKD